MGVEIPISFRSRWYIYLGEVWGPTNWQGVEHVTLQIDRSGCLRRFGLLMADGKMGHKSFIQISIGKMVVILGWGLRNNQPHQCTLFFCWCLLGISRSFNRLQTKLFYPSWSLSKHIKIMFRKSWNFHLEDFDLSGLMYPGFFLRASTALQHRW